MLRHDFHEAPQGSARRVYEVKSAVQKRSIVIGGHKTSVSLEDAFWESLKEIAAARGTTLSGLVAEVDAQRAHGNLSSAIRLFVLDHYRAPEFRAHDESLPHLSAPKLSDDGEQIPVKGLVKD
jgi:predicted DNA-binding ribbon-helix-helix protein